MKTHRAIVIAMFLLVLTSHPTRASSSYSMVAILEKAEIERVTESFPIPIRVGRLALAAGEDGWAGTLNDRWDSSNAFRGGFRQEFKNGLEFFLKTAGFQVTRSEDALQVKVTIHRFEGRRRIHDDGGDLEGSVKLKLGDKVLAEIPLFESLSYEDESDERPRFKEEFGLFGSIHFNTVLFYRLSFSFFESIAEALLESREVVTEAMNPSSRYESDREARATSNLPPALSKVGENKALPGRSISLVSVRSIPDRAEVYLDGRLIASTPAVDLPLDPGDYVLVIKAPGFRDWKREIRILKGGRIAFQATLERVDP